MPRFALLGFAVPVLAWAARGASPDPASLAVPPEQVARAKELVGRLGSPVFAERDGASRDLARMGRLALPALAANRDASDAEVRTRVGLLLRRAEVDDLRAQVDSFLADADGTYRHDLPGWDRFRLAAGDDPAARTLFAAVARNPANYDLLSALRPPAGPASAALPVVFGVAGAFAADRPAGREFVAARAVRAAEVYYRTLRPIPGGGGFTTAPDSVDAVDVAVLLLAEAVPTTSRPRVAAGGLPSVLYQPAAHTLLTRGDLESAPVLRRLVFHLLDVREGATDPATAMNVARSLNLGPAVVARYAARALTAAGPPFARLAAATEIARQGAKEYVPALTRVFADDTRLVAGLANGRATVQVQDVALAMALLLTGQDPTEYGFTAQPGAADRLKFTYQAYLFVTNGSGTGKEKRAAAFAKWRAWETGVYGAATGAAAVAGSHAARFPEKPDDDAK